MKWIARSLGSAREDEDVHREIRQHLDEIADELVRTGLSRDEAELAARRRFGNVTLIEERARDVWQWTSVNDCLRDVRSAVRQMRRCPLLTIVCALTLAIGIGANVAIFSTVYAVLLRPLPFKDPDRLVIVTEYKPAEVSRSGTPLLRYRERAAQNTVFEEMAGYWNVSGGNGLVFGGSGSAERLQFSVVTSSFFPLLGIRPVLGRTFALGEEAPDAAKVFLASYSLWQRLLGADAQAIGKTFRLDGEVYTLIGVLPRDFNFPAGRDLWLPIGSLGSGVLHDRVSHQFWILGRLRPHVTLAQSRADLDAIQRRLADAYPATDAGWRVDVRPLLDDLVGNVRRALWLLFAAVGFVLLIACTNVVNVLLARAVARENEFAVRAALGASRARLARQAFTESLMIVCAGASIALVLAPVGVRAIAALSAGILPRAGPVHVGAALIAFAAASAIVATLVVGVAPALHASGMALHGALQHGERTAFVSRRTTSWRNALIVSEVALTLVLVVGAGLMLRSFAQLRSVDPGFRAEQIVTMTIALPDARYPRVAQRTAFLQQLLERLTHTPGVRTVAATDRLPLSGAGNWGSINIEGRPLLDAAHAPAVEGRGVSAQYFRTMGIPLLRGRAFSDDDVDAHRPVVAINQAMADRFWPAADPIGRHIVNVDDLAHPREIIGVVGNVREFALDSDSPPEMYAPYGWWNTMTLVLRASVDPSSLVGTVRRQVESLDRNVPLYGVVTMDELLTRSLGRQRFDLRLFALFAVIGLALAAIGVYGVLAFTVGRRTHEIGLRIALGADASRVLTLVVAQGMKLVGLGLALGTIASLLLMRMMAGLLYRVGPADPLALGGGALTLAVVGVLACAIPARRAARISPIVALRGD